MNVLEAQAHKLRQFTFIKMPYIPTEENPQVELKPPARQDEMIVPRHGHTGTDSQAISIRNLNGLIEVVSTVPLSQPKNIYGQIKLYISGVESSLYFYDYTNDAWKYIGLT